MLVQEMMMQMTMLMMLKIADDVAGGKNDHLSGSDVCVLLDSILRRVDDHPATDRQLPATLTVPLHDAGHSLDRIQQQRRQPSHLRRHELPVPTQLQTGATDWQRMDRST